MIGKRLNARYQLNQIIGDGGMATVYEAKDVILDRNVAVKILRSEHVNDPEFIRRFHREAHAATSLAHPNIVNIYDVGEDEDIHYIVMELVEGQTLKEYINHNKPLALIKVIDIMTQLTDGIAHAHENNIIHRDIKPQNILIDDKGTVKVADFGIALASNSYTITHTTSVLGSVHYLSPEQARGGIVEEKSDIYSLGIVLFELVTGRVPYSGESAVSVAIKHLQGEAPSPKKWNTTLPQSFENIIVKAMARDPQYRYETVKDMQLDIETALLESRKNERRLVIPSDVENHTKVLPNMTAEADKHRQKKEQEPVEKNNKKVFIVFSVLFFLILSTIFASIVFPKLLSVNDVEVPSIVDMNEQQANLVLTKHQLLLKKQEVYDNEVPAGQVIEQSPKANTSVKEGSTIKVKISIGKKPIILESFVGKSKTQVEELLINSGINYEFVEEENDNYPENTIFDQEPGFGERFSLDSDKLIFYVSKGQPTFTLANLIGLTQGEVYRYMTENRLSISHQEQYSETIEKGVVIAQNPGFGTEVERGSEIEVIFSKGPKPEQPITVYKEIKINITDDNTYEIKISYDDANHENSTFVIEKISETTTYTLPLTINPKSTASYTVWINGVRKDESVFKYEDEKNS
jgi:eukaryotic-like serine/threonine-protein kinase